MKPASRPGQPGQPENKHSVARDSGGRFCPGSAANPSGRPPGSRNRLTLLLEDRLALNAEPLLQKTIDMALAGNILALRLCVERLLPVRREREMALNLPFSSSAKGLSAALGSVAEALTQGELTPTETNSAAMLLETARRAFETGELAQRVDELENCVEKAGSRGL